MLFEVSLSGCSPRQYWVCGVPSLYYYRFTHFGWAGAFPACALRANQKKQLGGARLEGGRTHATKCEGGLS